MKKFSEYVKDYKQWKSESHKGEALDEFDMAVIRESYAAKVREDKKATAKKSSNGKLIEAYRNWKLAEGLGDINKYDLITIKKMSESKEAKKPAVTPFQKALKELAEYKESKGLGAVTRSERVRLFEKLRAENKPAKKEEKLEENKVTVKSVFDKLNESKKCVAIAQKRLTEGDVMGAADATMAAGAAVTGAEGDATAMATPAAPVPQEVVDQISQVKTAVDALAAQAGIASPVDMGADPNAGVPAVTGAPADPAADAAAMDPNAMMESRVEESKARIEEAKKCDCDKCGVEVPPLKDLVKGTATGASEEAAPAETWPTEKIDEVPQEKKLGNVKESEEFSPDTESEKIEETAEEETEAEEKMEESKGLAEQRLEAELAKKNFNWGDFLKSGFNKR